MASKVYYMNDRGTSIDTSMVAKMLTVFDAAGLGELISPGDVVAIKVHCGEYNNTAYVRPVYARALADKVKNLGGRPFVCDTTTMTYAWNASRATALDEMLVAERNGFTSAALGCPFIVADGFFGTDDIRVDIPEGFILKEAYIAKGIALADVVIALSHFKGHATGVFGGAIKNLGIGCQSKRGKTNVHMGNHPKYSHRNAPYFPHMCQGRDCPQWHLCESCCPYGLFKVNEHNGDKPVFEWDQQNCQDCNAHRGVNGPCGVTMLAEDNNDAAVAAMADGALGVVKIVGRDKMGYVNLGIDITPNCDCAMFSDRAIVPNIGVFASKDPVAIDKACVEMVRQSVGILGSVADERGVAEAGLPKFPTTSSVQGNSEEIQTNVGALNGLGSREYELIEVQPGNREQFMFEWDKRPTGIRLRRMFNLDPVIPSGGFKRLVDVDLEGVR